METQIIINLQVEGLHMWESLDESTHEEVKYLKYPHRHIFKIKAYKLVTHADRDIEIIMLKRNVSRYLETQYYDPDFNCCNFESRSCEMIAQELAVLFNFDEVEVLEDGENGARVHNYINYSPVIVLVGPLCSGKTRYAQWLSKIAGYEHIKVSSVVKQFAGDGDRSHLQNTQQFNKDIARKLAEQANRFSHVGKKVVIDGPRYFSIFNYLNLHLNQEVSFFVMQTDNELRKQRYENRNRSEDVESFERVDLNEKELGLNYEIDLMRDAEGFYIQDIENN